MNISRENILKIVNTFTSNNPPSIELQRRIINILPYKALEDVIVQIFKKGINVKRAILRIEEIKRIELPLGALISSYNLYKDINFKKVVDVILMLNEKFGTVPSEIRTLKEFFYWEDDTYNMNRISHLSS